MQTKTNIKNASNYTTPVVEMIAFDAQDVIATSEPTVAQIQNLPIDTF